MYTEQAMESATFRKELTERGCRFDRHGHKKRGEGQVIEKAARRRFLLEAPTRSSTLGWCVRLVKSSALIGRNCRGRRVESEAW